MDAPFPNMTKILSFFKNDVVVVVEMEKRLDQVLMVEKVLLAAFQNSNLWNVMMAMEN
jgi:hypothetical protein